MISIIVLFFSFACVWRFYLIERSSVYVSEPGEIDLRALENV